MVFHVVRQHLQRNLKQTAKKKNSKFEIIKLIIKRSNALQLKITYSYLIDKLFCWVSMYFFGFNLN